MKFDLPQMVARSGTARRASLALPIIRPPKAYEDGLARIYVRVLRAASAHASSRLIPAYRQSMQALGVIRDSPTQIQGELDGMGDQLRRLVLELTPELQNWVVRIEAFNRARWSDNVKTATTVSLETLLGAAEVQTTMESVLAANIALIRDVSAQAQSRIAQSVWAGYQRRAPAREVAKEIDQALALGRKRSKRIAADQLQRLSARLDQERQEQAGIDSYIWMHSRKLHPRQQHVARDGKKFKWAEPPVGGHPGTEPFCGCKPRAFISFD